MTCFAIFPINQNQEVMTITTVFVTAAIVAGSTEIVLFEKQSTAHQLNRLHSNTIAIDGYIITFDDNISLREFILMHEYFVKKTCKLIKKPSIPKYRTNKGYMT